MNKLLVILAILGQSLANEEFTCGHLFYRTLYLDEASETLYVGAMDRLIRIHSVTNISSTDCERDSMHLGASNVANCVSKGKTRDYDCRNHIRVIQPIGDGRRLYVCGTNAHSPKDEVIYSNLTRLARHEFYPGIGDGIAKCPFDPEDNSTALWVESGNPGGHPAIYSGTNAEFTKADTVIFRGDIFDTNTGRREYTFKRTIKYDSHMLDKPDFVGSYDVGGYVYFFFRETAVEYMNCGKTVYSRIARVCKRDTGGKNILHQNWATYLKARLNCSLPGEFPFFFNEIQDVYKPSYDDTTFHAVFSTSQNGLKGSAICSFNLEDVEKVFEGKFKEQATSTSMWLPVPSAKVPDPRPGSCVDDTRQLPDTVLNFIRKHPLMDSDVPHDAQGPAFYKRDVIFTKIAVDDQVTTTAHRYGDKEQYTVYYAGTNDGHIYKVARWRGATGKFQSRLLDVLPAVTPEPVRALALSRKLKMLYVTSDSVIKQIPLGGPTCTARYKNCVQCVHDPYCGWDREAGICAMNSPHLLQDPSGEAEGLCEASLHRQKLSVNFGSSFHLACTLRQLEDHQVQEPTITWYHYDLNGKRRKIDMPTAKHVFTQDNGLVIIGMGERDAGRYDCRLGRETVSSYQLTVDLQRCAAPNKTADYQKVYSDWCHEFQKYKTALKTWEKKRSTTCGNANNPALAAATTQDRNSLFQDNRDNNNPFF